MSVITPAPTTVRRVGAGLLATLATVAALATVVCVLAWLWAAAVGALAVLLGSTTAFWSVLGSGAEAAVRSS